MADPLFVNATGDAAAVDLHLQASNPAEGGGLTVATVTDDFDGQTRGNLTPVDIGADAGNFTSSSGDIYAPFITCRPLSNGSTANRTLTGWATIMDNSGSVADGSKRPRLYYKKATDANIFNAPNDSAGNGWKYVTGTASGGSYSFTIDYTLLSGGGVSVGDSIQYFVVAQDAANNLASNPAAATASDNPPVQNIRAKPGAGVSSYSIVAPLSGGTVTVGGANGTYPSLSGAGGLFSVLDSRVISGNLTVNLAGDTTETGSTALNTLNSNQYPDPAFTVTIQPDSAVMRTISGSAAGGLIRLNGAQRVTIDGSVGGSGRFLTFRNNSTSGATLTFINDASKNMVRNCVLEGANTDTTQGVVFFSTGAITGNDNNTVTGNQIRDRGNGAGVPGNLVYSGGASGTVANSSNTISNNELLNFTSRGIYVAFGSDPWEIISNTIYQTAPRTTQLFGIQINGPGTNTIRGNTVRDLTTSRDAYGIYLSTQTGDTAVAGNRIWNLGPNTGYGIYLSPQTGSATVSGNRIWNVGTDRYGMGIAFLPAAGRSVTAVNNMVTLSSSAGSGQFLYGFYEAGATGSTTVTASNTVLLTGTTGGETWAFRRLGTSTATVKNNIFLNLRTGGGNHYAANYSAASTGSLIMDYNVYAGTAQSTAANFFDGGASGNTYGTPISFAEWQANLPGDSHSSAGNPGGNYTGAMFVDAANGDLHLVPGGNPLTNDAGVPVAGVTTDYDGAARSLTTPDIGADELPTAFQQWAQANGVGNDPQSPGANGLANLLNFAFGLNPNTATLNALSHTGNVITPGSIATELLSGTPTVKFIRRADYAALVLTYTAQFSADLSNWEPDITTPTLLATDGVNEVASLNYPLLAGGARARFFRLVVSLQ